MTAKTAEKTEGAAQSHRNEKVGEVVSTKMQKTIVVAVEMRKAHTKYKRVVRSTKNFYAHDEDNTAHVGRRGPDPRDPAPEQAQAVAAGGDYPAFLPRTGS